MFHKTFGCAILLLMCWGISKARSHDAEIQRASDLADYVFAVAIDARFLSKDILPHGGKIYTGPMPKKTTHHSLVVSRGKMVDVTPGGIVWFEPPNNALVIAFPIDEKNGRRIFILVHRANAKTSSALEKLAHATGGRSGSACDIIHASPHCDIAYYEMSP